jgi:Glycosyltransferase family 20
MTEGASDTADPAGMAIDPLSADRGYYRVGAATRRLVVVSNRVTSTGGAKPDSGGLAVAIRSALQESGGVWFGWSGEVVEDPTDEPGIAVDGPLTFATLDLSRRDYNEYYIGYANRVLWPLFHYRSELVEFSRRYLAGYLRVNQMFARKLAPMRYGPLKPGGGHHTDARHRELQPMARPSGLAPSRRTRAATLRRSTG